MSNENIKTVEEFIVELEHIQSVQDFDDDGNHYPTNDSLVKFIDFLSNDETPEVNDFYNNIKKYNIVTTDSNDNIIFFIPKLDTFKKLVIDKLMSTPDINIIDNSYENYCVNNDMNEKVKDDPNTLYDNGERLFYKMNNAVFERYHEVREIAIGRLKLLNHDIIGTGSDQLIRNQIDEMMKDSNDVDLKSLHEYIKHNRT